MATRHINFQIHGMTCQACASRIEKVLNKKDFVHNASVSFAGESAQIEYDDAYTNPEALMQIIAKTGFEASLPTSRLPAHQNESHWHTWALLVLAAPFMLGMLGMLFGSHALMPPLWVQIVLATVVQTYFAVPFYRGAMASVRGGLANMDVLVALGTLSIYVYSLGMVWTGHAAHHVYFEAGVMVLAFVSLGKYWEAKTKRGSLNALGALVQMTPQEVSVFKNEQWQTVPLGQVQMGDVLRCVQGGRIAADGVVLAGEGWADESHLTGESQPVYKSAGSHVLAGSMCAGSLDYRADSLGNDTLLGDMVAALADAQASKAPIARLADKVAAFFVPTVVAIAVLTWGVNWLVLGDFAAALMRGVAVLVVACPCALGLATPAAMMAGMGVAVRHGVWFKNAAVLERAGAVNAVVLDKTGTLTMGKPELRAIWTAEHVDETRLLSIAAAVERHAMHPLAQAIVQAAENRQIDVLNAHQVNTVAGEGMVAHIDGVGEIRVGKLTFCDCRLPAHLDGMWQIASLVAVSVNGQAIGALALADAPKPDSATVLQNWQTQAIEIYVLSGDNEATVAHLAQTVGLPAHRALGNQSPRDKADFVQQLQQQGKIVAMVGDGINDAPALARADVGFAVRGSTDIAQSSADVVLVRHELQAMAQGLTIARTTVKNIKQNLFFAFIYNILGMPLAAIGLLTPVLAGAMMAMSSISVLGNALRLKKQRF